MIHRPRHYTQSASTVRVPVRGTHRVESSGRFCVAAGVTPSVALRGIDKERVRRNGALRLASTIMGRV